MTRPRCGEGCLEHLDLADEHGYGATVGTYLWPINWPCARACNNGHLDCLKYAHEHGAHWTAAACSSASLQGNFECLRYAHENGCPWNESACSNAAGGGHLAC